MRSITLTTSTSIALLASAAATAGTQTYTITDLGTIAGANEVFEPGSVAAGVSNIVVGYSVTDLPKRNFHAYRSVGGVMQDLGVLPDDQHSMAFATNAAGDVVGVSYKLGEIYVHGVLWTAAGGTVNLGNVEPHDINASGAIAASAAVPGAIGTTHATLIVGGSSTDLGTLGGPSSMALGINDSNWVVGQAMLSDARTTRAFVYRNGSMLDLGTLGGVNSRALDVNGLRIVGVADTATGGTQHATMWTMTAAGALGTTTDLGTLRGANSSSAYAVNADGVAVGISGDAAAKFSGGTVIDLNTAIAPNQNWHLHARSASTRADESWAWASTWDSSADSCSPRKSRRT